jgi:hypothetical protein
MAEQEACDIISQWGNSGFFRLRNMGDKIFVTKISPGAAYTIRLQTHYEQRTVHQAQAPFHGGQVDNHGQAPGPWQVPVRRPEEFEERVERVPVPHTERVEMCAHCAGQGRVTCGMCNGRGQVPCSMCGGTGMRQRQVMDTTRNAQGNPVSMPRMIQERCSCGNGVVRCGGCGGHGVVRCSTCAGTGRVKVFDQILVRFQAAKQGELLDVTPVPDRWFGHLTGEALVEEKSPRVERFEPVKPDVDQKANELLAESHTIDRDTAQILLQWLRIDRIPLHEVDYKYAGTERKLWICGNERDIYAPKAPWNRTRMALLIGFSVLAIAAIVGVVAGWVLRMNQ